MRFHQWLKVNGVLVAAAAALVMANPARAHVRLDLPNGGEELEVGSIYTIQWTILIQHNQLNWDLWYSTTGSNGPWIEIAMDLPPGSFAPGSVHTYDWTVPDDPDDSVWVRVRMDNSGTDYFDVSNAPFSIVPAPVACPWDIDGDGTVGAVDLLSLLTSWGPCKGCPADFDGDGTVGATDLLALLVNWGPCP
ncbi:MAG: hypothetical protein V3T84_09015 [Phycisphaerales bacterium]